MVCIEINLLFTFADDKQNSSHKEENRIRFRELKTTQVSPISFYGHLPKTKILSLKDNQTPIVRQCKVKISPFPHFQRNAAFPQPSFEKVEPVSSGLLNVTSDTPKVPNGNVSNFTSPPSASTYPAQKRSITFNSDDDSSDDKVAKKSKNETDTNHTGKRAYKRTSPESDEMPHISFNSNKKKIKNNEILSSYSSTTMKSIRLKRKLSPELLPSVASFPKKRTHIEELELLTSNDSPYYKNIYSPLNTLVNNSEAKPMDESVGNGPPSATSKNISTSPANVVADQLLNLDHQDKETEENMKTDTDDADIDDKEVEDDTNKSLVDEQLYPLPVHVHSIKDHEYDRKKVQNRLNRFLEAVQEANKSSDVTGAISDTTTTTTTSLTVTLAKN